MAGSTAGAGDVAAPRRRALWAALAALVVGGASLAFVAADSDDAGGVRQLPVGLASSASAAESDAAGASSRPGLTYVAADDLPALGGQAEAHRLLPEVDEARVSDLAAALGLDGDPISADGRWTVASDDGVLEVLDDGTGGWWFSRGGWFAYPPDGPDSPAAPACVPGPATDCGFGAPSCAPVEEGVGTGEDCALGPAEPVAPDTAATATTADLCPEGTGRCETSEAGGDLPPREQAEVIAVDLLTAAGVDLEGARVRVEGPFDAWVVTVEPLVDGVPVVGGNAMASVGPGGRVTYASGTVAGTEGLGPYPLVDTRAALDRLNGEVAGAAVEAPEPAADPTSTTDLDQVPSPDLQCQEPGTDCEGIGGVGQCKVQPDGREICEQVGSSPSTTYIECPEADPAAGPDEPVSSDCPDPAPAPPVVPELQEIVLTEVEQVLVQMPAIDGSNEMYLVPGYRFRDEDGIEVTVPAVVEDLIQTTPATADTGTGAVVPGEVPPSVPTTSVPGQIGSSDPDLTYPEDGEPLEIGVGYYVEVDVMTGHCSWVSAQVGGRWWIAQMSNEALADWSTPTEGGTFTLLDEDTAEFVGDSARTKVAKMSPLASQPGCV